MMASKLLFVVTLLLLACACFGQTPVIVGQTYVLHSQTLNEDREYQVCLPASYHWAADRSYPVLYVLDGESNFLHTASSVSYLSTHGEIPELIVVGITSTVRIRDFTQTDWSSHWVGGGGARNFRQFLSAELIPAIEKNFRTNHFRILSGHSAGGQFALYALASEPSLFNAYFAISPSLDWDNGLPERSLAESFAHADSLKAFLYFAWSDDLGQALEADQKLVGTLKAKSPRAFRWVANGMPDETHISIPLPAHIDALRQLFAGYRFHDDLLVNGIGFAEKHFEAVSATVGYTIPVPEDVINNFGYEELGKGNVQAALVFFKRNIAQNPYSANAYDGIADAYEKAAMWPEAIGASEKSIELERRFADPSLGYFAEHLKKIKDKSTMPAGR
jgi:uncharacterized protein